MSELTQQNFDNFNNGENICPILDNPELDCFCADMNSLTIPYMVKYCLRHFRACSIYQRVKKEGRRSRTSSDGTKCKPFL
ncbi:MAG: hypothetical protein PVI45_02745, partial [Desulfobacterales bacterium]|jgi:hypothetical protein